MTVKPLSVFLDTDQESSAVEGAIAHLVGQPLARRDLDVGTVFGATTFGVEILLLDEHGLVDDCGIPFTQYEYQLELVPLAAGMESPRFGALYEAMAMFLAERLSKTLRCRALVVANLQRQVAEFDSRRKTDGTELLSTHQNRS